MPEKVIWQNNRDKLPPEIATLQEPFGNAVFATMNQDLSGQSVAVLGCGPIGLFTIGIARAVGAKAVFASDIQAHRIELARRMGASEVFNPAEDGDVVAGMVEANGGYGVDVVLEMSGAPSAITTASSGEAAWEASNPSGGVIHWACRKASPRTVRCSTNSPAAGSPWMRRNRSTTGAITTAVAMSSPGSGW